MATISHFCYQENSSTCVDDVTNQHESLTKHRKPETVYSYGSSVERGLISTPSVPLPLTNQNRMNRYTLHQVLPSGHSQSQMGDRKVTAMYECNFIYYYYYYYYTISMGDAHKTM